MISLNHQGLGSLKTSQALVFLILDIDSILPYTMFSDN